MIDEIYYTGKAWKHHIASDFIYKLSPTSPNGAGKGGTIFLDFDKMLDYLKCDGREWYIAELSLSETPITFDFGCDYMATIQTDLLSEEGFFHINLH